ncbi:MAG: hypothetical protein IKB95_01160, partial [Bacteroidales bacterium]|nr:hypothetical protein [Bacteroidales bacterium]
IYILSNLSLHSICNADSYNPYLKCNIITSDKSLGYLPYTFRYIFDNGCESGAYACFDNAQVCYGEPLKIIITGTAPYEIFYNFDGNQKNITTSKTEYTMPNTPGKYTITKIKDQYCEIEPTKDNTSEILPQLNKLHIIKE